MGKNLAIKGHPTRGKEVIELLEMMGGVNSDKAYGNLPNNWDVSYYIFKDGVIKLSEDKILTKKQFKIFTLEEFLEKYPFKVGDFVRIPEYESEVRICKMKWCPVSKHIEYMVCPNDEEEWFTANELLDYNDNPNETPKNKEEKKINQMSLANCDLDEVEIVLGDKFELKIEDGKYYAVRKKPKYPTTYKECCDVLKIPNDERYIDIDVPLDYNKLVSSFTELLICYNAYRKIAGEQMRLDKPWKPDWSNDDETKFCIYTTQNIISLDIFGVDNRILAFPTEEIRDAFYKNFKKEIEQCKELL